MSLHSFHDKAAAFASAGAAAVRPFRACKRTTTTTNHPPWTFGFPSPSRVERRGRTPRTATQRRAIQPTNYITKHKIEPSQLATVEHWMHDPTIPEWFFPDPELHGSCAMDGMTQGSSFDSYPGFSYLWTCHAPSPCSFAAAIIAFAFPR